MKKFFLFITISAFLMNAKATGYDFPLSEFGALWGHTAVHIDYTEGDPYVQVTYDPEVAWATQSGWEFGDSPKDFTGYTHLILDFEAVNVSTDIQFVVESTVTVETNSITKNVANTANRAVIDLKAFTPEQLVSIARVSIWIWDDVAETAVFNVKGVTLIADDSYFPLIALGALWGNTALSVDYDPGDAYAEVTLEPAAPWAAQVGWEFSGNPVDLTGYISLVCEFEEVNANDGNVELVVTSSVAEGGIDSYNTSIQVTDNQISLDLTQFMTSQLASIIRVSLLVWDDDALTATLKVKDVTLVEDTGGGTGINEVIGTDNKIVDVYSITGFKIRSQVNKNEVMKELPAGLYIIDKQKVFVK